MQLFSAANMANLWPAMVIALVILIVWTVVLSVQLYRLHGRYRKAMSFGDDLDVEQALGRHSEQLQANTAAIQSLTSQIESEEALLQRTLQHVGLVRFNPFADAGGDQSFSVALLDANNSGVVISSLHSREGTRVYAKPVTAGESSYTLSEEEQSAITRATKGR